jgi:hypothetical protein
LPPAVRAPQPRAECPRISAHLSAQGYGKADSTSLLPPSSCL